MGALLLAAVSGGLGYVAVTAFRTEAPEVVSAPPRENETVVEAEPEVEEPIVEEVAVEPEVEPEVEVEEAPVMTPRMRAAMRRVQMTEPATAMTQETPMTETMMTETMMTSMSGMRFNVQRDWDG